MTVWSYPTAAIPSSVCPLLLGYKKNEEDEDPADLTTPPSAQFNTMQFNAVDLTHGAVRKSLRFGIIPGSTSCSEHVFLVNASERFS